jgi:hypothetical protein
VPKREQPQDLVLAHREGIALHALVRVGFEPGDACAERGMDVAVTACDVQDRLQQVGVGRLLGRSSASSTLSPAGFLTVSKASLRCLLRLDRVVYESAVSLHTPRRRRGCLDERVCDRGEA